MPKVTHKFRFFLCCLAMLGPMHCAAQIISSPGPAEVLYKRLGSVGLDPSRVFKIRDASIDRASLHVSLTDGTVAFTEDVSGHITGAFFEGEGEVLLIPPDQVERSSMTLFTGAAILEEKFATAYLRFNDDTYNDLRPFLRPRENPEDFIAKWNDTAQNLAQSDALRLLLSFSRLLPGDKPGAGDLLDPNDRMLHLKVQGLNLGIFDLFFDLAASEQISAGQLKNENGKDFYDVWTSFAIKKNIAADATSEIAGEEESRGDISISSYKIDAAIQLPAELAADARLEMSVIHGGKRAITFELSRNLKIQKVEADGQPVEFIHNPSLDGTQLARRGDDLVVVIFPHPLLKGQKIALRFDYEGPVLSEAGNGLVYVGARGTWYPNRGFVKASFDLTFRAPAGWTLIATGHREENLTALTPIIPIIKDRKESVATAPGTQLSRWVSTTPIPVAGFNLGKYAAVTKQSGPVTVGVYAAAGMERGFPKPDVPEIDDFPGPPTFPVPPRISALPVPIPLPPSPRRNAEEVANNAIRALSFFSSRIAPFPYRDLAITQIPGAISQGWPGLIFLSSFSFLSSDEKSALHVGAADQAISDLIIAHETAHQWWGDLVTWSGYRDQWISEGLANYSALLLLESRNPSQFRAILQKYRDDLLKKTSNGVSLADAGPVTLGSRLSSSKFQDGYNTIAYERGTWLFHMLRALMSPSAPSGKTRTSVAQSPDEPFFRALRALTAQYQNRPISTGELISVFEKQLPSSAMFEGKKSLDWFYQGWVAGTSIPSLELRSVKFSDKAERTEVSGIIRQKYAPDTLVTPIPAYAVVAGKRVSLGIVFADGPETQFHLLAPVGVRKLLLDPDQTVLLRPH